MLTAEARERVERFRYKTLHPPPAWSDKKWHDTCAALAKLVAGFGEETVTFSNSPVTGY
ncbi:MAG: hypothetical protein NTV46_07520 [Verrucomicrobia bacterium]|nr:hypothetical protein [Verrucomicrobiota bacterium]